MTTGNGVKEMKTRIYAASFGQRYAIAEDKYGFTVLRKLPNDEYWDYYRERLDELCMDDALAHWLPIYRAWAPKDAERFLNGIGVDCAVQEVPPCNEGEGRFTETARNARALAFI